jgi:hypothetical protein
MSEANFTPTEPVLVDTPITEPVEPMEPVLMDKPVAPPAPPPAPAPTAKTPPKAEAATGQAAPTASAVDERAYQQYQALAQVVLDSAHIATKSATAAASASRDMHAATGEFRALTETGHKKALILLGATGGLLIICLIFFLTMGVRMNSRINQLDSMMLAVGKRVVDLNAGLESLDVINKSIESLTAQQVEQAKTQGQLETRINEALKKSETMVQGVPGETAKQVAATSDNLLKQVQGINSKLQTQAGAVQALGSEVKALKGAVGNVDKLNREVEALVTLQKERYLETLQKTNSTQTREKAVQFPRVAPPKPADPAPASGSQSSSTGPK